MWVRKGFVLLFKGFVIIAAYVQRFTVGKLYYIAVVARYVIEIHNVCTVNFAKTVFRKSAVNMSHGFFAVNLILPQAYKTVLIVRLKIKYIVRLEAKGVAAAFYPKRPVGMRVKKEFVKRRKQRFLLLRFQKKAVRHNPEGLENKIRIRA